MASGSKIWTVFSLGAALGAAAVAKKGLNTTWRATTGKNPPANPADPDVDLWEAIAWAAVSGTMIGIARMLATRKAGERARGSVLGSDAFFPFPDGVEAAAEAGVRVILQPGGSKNDESVIEAAAKAGVAMFVTGFRHFRH